MRELHQWLAWFVVLANGAVGAWALAAHLRPALRHRVLWWATGVAEVAIVGQVVLGVLLLTVDDREVDQFHQFYGFIALASVGIIYSYRQQLAGRTELLYGLGGLFLMGLGIRSMVLS